MISRLLFSPRKQDIAAMDTAALRSAFLVQNIFTDGGITMAFTDLDRMAVGGVQPRGRVELENDRQSGADFFLQRREIGIMNVGGRGKVRVDGRDFDMNALDCLYVGMGARSVSFEGDGHTKFFLLSCPAHQTFPTTLIRKDECKPIALGSQATSNQRKIYQYIHPGGVKSAQLVMGFTELADGNVWNSMPPHTHTRRTEIYFYFDLGENIVSHFLGAPDATRHVFVHNEQAVLSPPWSIHCGCGTSAYKFIWAMAGENQVFDDMDKLTIQELR